MKNYTTDTFTYLGGIICQGGRADVDIKNRINTARGVFFRLKPVWRSTVYSRRTKLMLYQSCVLSTLLYGSDCWRITERDPKYMSTFHTKCLRNIMRIFWPQIFPNMQLFKTTGQDIVNNRLATRRWRWIGHVLRKKDDSISQTALLEKENVDDQKTWRKTVENELEQLHLSLCARTGLSK